VVSKEDPMKVLVQFDASVSSYEIRNELSSVSSWSGIGNVKLLERISGEVPRYCVEAEVADDQAQGFHDRLGALTSRYSGYVYNVKELAYRDA
jgi:hypothetical protein